MEGRRVRMTHCFRFTHEIKVTIEAGHANFQANEVSSVAYWYCNRPTAVQAPPPVAQRKPIRRDNTGHWIIEQPSLCPGPDVSQNPEFLKAKNQYRAVARQNGWPDLKI